MTGSIPSAPAARHPTIAGLFTDRVLGTREWDAPTVQARLLGFIGRAPFWRPPAPRGG